MAYINYMIICFCHFYDKFGILLNIPNSYFISTQWNLHSYRISICIFIVIYEAKYYIFSRKNFTSLKFPECKKSLNLVACCQLRCQVNQLF